MSKMKDLLMDMEDESQRDQYLEKRNIGEACVEYQNLFAANKNLYRVIPSVIDGLKPGQRRLLYSMYLYSDRKVFTKCAKLVGDTVGSFHPHGDIPVYETLTNLAQWWNNTIVTIEPSGNFGSINGDRPAASRYTEAKLSNYAYKCFFEDFNEYAVDMKDNYSGRLKEPEYLPARYPHILINGTLGIGTGLASNIPPFNLKEVFEATIKLIRDPDAKIFLLPDSPTGCYIVDNGEFQNVIDTGIGKYKMRGIFEVDGIRNVITIKNIPYQTTLDNISLGILDLIEDKKLKTLNIEDSSNQINGIHYEITLPQDTNAEEIVEFLYKKNIGMEKTFPVNLSIIDDYKNYEWNMYDVLKMWIEYRRDAKRSYYNYKLIKASEENHINEILLFILNKNNAEKTLKIMKSSANRGESVRSLMDAYSITSLQASSIADMKLSAFTKDSYTRYEERKISLGILIDKYTKMIDDPDSVDNDIVAELEEGIKLFGVPRKSKIINLRKKKDIPNTSHLVIVSQDGYVKKYGNEISNFGNVGKDKSPCTLIRCDNVDNLLIFDEKGTVSKVSVSSIPLSTEDDIGVPLSRYFTVDGAIISIIREPQLDDRDTDFYVLMATSYGFIKKTKLLEFKKIKDMKSCIKLDDGDKLISVDYIMGVSLFKDLLIYTNKGDGIRIDINEVRSYGSKAKGLKSINLKDGEYVVGTNKIESTKPLLLYVTKNGKVKITQMKYFPQMKRRAETLSLLVVDDNDEILCIKSVNNKNHVKLLTRKGVTKEFDIGDLTPASRQSKAEKLFTGMRGDEVVGYVIE